MCAKILATAQHPTCRRPGAPVLLCYFFAIGYTVCMVAELTLIVRPQDEHNDLLLRKKAREQLAQKNIRVRDDELHLVCVKKSIDARHGNVKLCLKYNAYSGEEAIQNDAIPEWKHADGKRRVIIVGAGPAGLFGALRLLEDGITPVLVERGTDTAQRKKDIAAISTQHVVDANSNYCFGEGGAGAFSDGKLYTRSGKRGNVPRILRIFNHFGADANILTDAHPHIGTDKLPKIINAMREKIIALGGEFHFNMKCVDVLIAHDESHDDTMQSGTITTGAIHGGTSATSSMRADARSGTTATDAAHDATRPQWSGTVCGIVAQHTKTGARVQFTGDAVLFATGHSASDIYELLAKIAPHALAAKPFALGVRVEHPRARIDAIQYHGKQLETAAEYRLATHVDGRGVYSFCMCPGGFVVPSSTSNDEIVINGMSSARRNSVWSNAAIVVETTPEDIPREFVAAATADGCPALAGLYWRTHLEREAKKHGDGQHAPAQRLEDFLAHYASSTLPATSYTPGVAPSRLDKWLPPHSARRLAVAFVDFNKRMSGFISRDALLIAIETRTSTPVRMLRDKETYESTVLKNLYVAGEGSGYSGGIVSSAIDGENACAAIAKRIAK